MKSQLSDEGNTQSLESLRGLSNVMRLEANKLTEEAVVKARAIKYERLTTYVTQPEHLVAIMITTGRTKDYLRIAMFLEQKTVNRRSLMVLLRRYGLIQKWKQNEFRFTR